MPERTDKLRMPSLDVLWAHLRAYPHVVISVRTPEYFRSCRASFVRWQNGFVKFTDWHGQPVIFSLRPDPEIGEWGIRFFPGGVRFRRGRLVMTVYFGDGS